MTDITSQLHLPDDYCYCRRCGLLITELPTISEPCEPPEDVLKLVNRRLASIVLTNAMESEVQWAVKSLTDDALRKSKRARYEDDDDATRHND